MSRSAKVALFLLLGFASLIFVVAAPDWHAGEEDYWRDASGAGRGDVVRQADWATCGEIMRKSPDQDGIRDAFSCMERRGWKLVEAGPSGPENAGRFVLLFFVLPVLALFALAIAVTRGRYQVMAVNALIVTACMVVIYISGNFIRSRLLD